MPHVFHVTTPSTIPGLAVAMFDGRGLSRVQRFLLGSLKQSNATKYLGALERLNNELAQHGVSRADMNDSQQDEFVSEWLMDCHESGLGRTESAWALSALQKIFPRSNFKTAWKVLDCWQQQSPPKQAPAAPPEVIHALITMSLMLNRPQLACTMLLCYVGLLRVREALNLCWNDVIIDKLNITLCLGRTKRGMEQRVVLTNSAVCMWITQYAVRFPANKGDSPFINISYSSALRGVQRVAFLLGLADLKITTHSFRRSGASELSRLGMPLQDILLYGRWLSERAARDYIRRGEVAVIRAKQQLNPGDWNRVLLWGSFAPKAWPCYDYMYQESNFSVSVRQLTPHALAQVELPLFQQCKLPSIQV